MVDFTETRFDTTYMKHFHPSPPECHTSTYKVEMPVTQDLEIAQHCYIFYGHHEVDNMILLLCTWSQDRE